MMPVLFQCRLACPLRCSALIVILVQLLLSCSSSPRKDADSGSAGAKMEITTTKSSYLLVTDEMIDVSMVNLSSFSVDLITCSPVFLQALKGDEVIETWDVGPTCKHEGRTTIEPESRHLEHFGKSFPQSWMSGGFSDAEIEYQFRFPGLIVSASGITLPGDQVVSNRFTIR